MQPPEDTDPLLMFHPWVRDWFLKTYPSPTACQIEAWKTLRAGRHTLIAAPTGSGKTLAAFLSAIDRLIRERQEGRLEDKTRIVYLSPLKALSNDIKKNLEGPLGEILQGSDSSPTQKNALKVAVRTGDTPARDRQSMLRHPPHILVTTPESFFILLTSSGGRQLLADVDTVIVDEIHSLIETKRGAHLALSLERLDRLTGLRVQRIGLSATQHPIDQAACFLTGGAPCTIVDQGHLRTLSIEIELPPTPLEAVLSQEQGHALFDRMACLISATRTTIVFVNTRRQAERIARALTERLGEQWVTSHHGSLARKQRLDAEERLKSGQLRALVATSSLELGIDVGTIDQVFQWGSTHSIMAFLQRVGRSGHTRDGIPKGYVFPTSRDDLLECIALVQAIKTGSLERLVIPDHPLDVLSQHIVSMVACETFAEDELYAMLCKAWPYRALGRASFDQVIDMLANGFSTTRGVRGAYLHRDQVHRILRPRPSARLTAITCGGTIPDAAEYRVMLEPAGDFIGSVDEDFALESTRGDIFQLGNSNWRILGLDQDKLRVEDAKNQPPTLPFWFGEAPGRSVALSKSLSDIRLQLERLFKAQPDERGVSAARQWLTETLGISGAAALQASHYLFLAFSAFQCLPSMQTIVFERFFDDTGGMQLIIHAPLGSRANRAWGLALRKRFCRTFNFELQATATEEAILLSLGGSQSFPLESVARYLTPDTVREVLIQAVLDAPMFTARWRWNALNALAIRRFQSGRKTPPHLLRMQSEDLVTAVFPDQLACLENIVGERRIPDHPLVEQTLTDCLTEAMDLDHLISILEGIGAGQIRVEARNVREASPLALEIIHARAYSFLDGAPLQERRTRAVTARRWLDIGEAQDLSGLNPSMVKRACMDAWPKMDTIERLHDGLMTLSYLLDSELNTQQRPLLDDLVKTHRAGWIQFDADRLWLATERAPWFQAVHLLRAPLGSTIEPPDLQRWIPIMPDPPMEAGTALNRILRARLGSTGPRTADRLSAELRIPLSHIEQSLIALENEGSLVQGFFLQDATLEWCDRHLLSRIHRLHLQSRRLSITPVTPAVFMQFLFQWQKLSPEHRLEGPGGVALVIEQLQGVEAPTLTWEQELLPARIRDYDPSWLDQLCLSGKVVWGRLAGDRQSNIPIRSTPIMLIERRHLNEWLALYPSARMEGLSSTAEALFFALEKNGALFFDELLQHTALLSFQAEQGLAELVARGLTRCDGFQGLRALLSPAGHRVRGGKSRLEEAGRWTLLNSGRERSEDKGQTADPKALIDTLLGRYGLLFRALVRRASERLPWSDLLPVLRRMEAQGELRSGRFLTGQFGEQFALEGVAQALDKISQLPGSGALMTLNACDPACLISLFNPELSLAALRTNRVLYRDGQPIALKRGKDIQYLEEPHESAWTLRHALTRLPSAPVRSRTPRLP